MPSEQLKQALQTLHAELAEATDVDPEMLSLLATLDDDIHGLLAGQSAQVEPHGVMDAAESLAARFAADHPRAEALLREVIAALAKMGV